MEIYVGKKHKYYLIITTDDNKYVYRYNNDRPFGIPVFTQDIKCSEERLICYLEQLGIFIKHIKFIKNDMIANKLSNYTRDSNFKDNYYVIHCTIDSLDKNCKLDKCNILNVQREMNESSQGNGYATVNGIEVFLLKYINTYIPDASLLKCLNS